MSFSSLDLDQQLLQAIEDSGYTTPTPIQEQAIPLILENKDLLASAQTGTGKTAAFILPALHKLATNPRSKGKGPLILILVPTRELATQVASQAVKYSKYMQQIKTVCIYGGIPYHKQQRDLSRPYEILVATPGRLIDYLERGRISLSRVQLFILDEADRMLDMGFIEPVEQIADLLPKTRQTLLFSATLKGSVLGLSKRLLTNPIEVTIEQTVQNQESIEQRLYNVDNFHHKKKLLDHFLTDPTLNQAIIFTTTKRDAEELATNLMEQDYNVSSLHGDMNQKQRNRTIHQMRKGLVRILVATDVAARGIDITSITHVINFNLPHNPEDYVHRIGRTGRAGAKGVALSFVEFRDRGLVKQIEKFTGAKMTAHTVPGLEPQPRGESPGRPGGFQKRSRKPPFKGNFGSGKPSSRPKSKFRPKPAFKD